MTHLWTQQTPPHTHPVIPGQAPPSAADPLLADVAIPGAGIPAPRTVDETGIRRALLEEIALKTIYVEGELNLRELTDRMGLGLPIVDELFQRLRKTGLCEVTGMVGSTHRVTTSSQGKVRAQELLARSLYAGIAPVSLAEYAARVRAQTVSRAGISPADVQRAFAPLVLSDELMKQLGVAVLSGTSIVLYGETGTGKTAIAEHIPRIYHGGVWIPHAVEVDGQIIAIYDPGIHRRIETTMPREVDWRWVLCERPRVSVGGELTIDMLDLQYNAVTGYYAAPLQMRANNGVLVLDDFGRQRIRPEMLLNRWIVPLDRQLDFLTLQGGKKFEVPFDVLVIFSTNFDPAAGFASQVYAGVRDDAFLRRIPNKIKVGYASREQFHEIFRRVCAQFGVAYDAPVVDRTIDFIESGLHQPLRPCYPRDIVQQICWEARFQGTDPVLDSPAVARACRAYFLIPAEA